VCALGRTKKIPHTSTSTLAMAVAETQTVAGKTDTGCLRRRVCWPLKEEAKWPAPEKGATGADPMGPSELIWLYKSKLALDVWPPGRRASRASGRLAGWQPRIAGRKLERDGYADDDDAAAAVAAAE